MAVSEHLDGVEIDDGGGEGHQGGVEAIEHATVAGENVAGVLDAEDALEERLHEIAPGAEDDDHQSESGPFDSRQLQVVHVVLLREMP